MYRKQLREVPSSASLDFIAESWKKMVIPPSGIDRQYYEICAMNELKGALRAGDIWIRSSRRYKNFDDYLMPGDNLDRVGSHGRYSGQVNLKYGQEPGVQFYTHISDQYNPFYTKVISRIRDSTHVLDGLLYHESDLEITDHYTDTAGFMEHVLR